VSLFIFAVQPKADQFSAEALTVGRTVLLDAYSLWLRLLIERAQLIFVSPVAQSVEQLAVSYLQLSAVRRIEKSGEFREA
jgi:hypothetical protein